MTLEDFEKELAEQKEAEKRRERRKEHEKSEHRHRHHHRSSRHGDSHYDEEDGHRSKRTRHSKDDDASGSRHRHRHHHHHHRRRSRGEDDTQEEEENEKEEKQPATSSGSGELKRDSWMEAPSALDIDYIQRKRPEPSPQPKGGSLEADFGLKVHERELNHHLRDLKNGTPVDNDLEADEPATHEVDYTFGDAGSQWRMTRLKAVYRQAEETGRKVEEVALERYDSLREFDDAREEKIELDRRKTYGDGYVGKDKSSGELFQERKMDAGVRRPHPRETETSPDILLDQMPVPATTATTQKIDQTALNKLKAQLMRATMRKDPKAADLEREYNDALAAFESQDPTVITLSAMDNRMLSSAPRNEVKAVQNRRGAERGQVEENEEMSIEDMVREERRTRGQQGGEGLRLAERIAKDSKFDNDLDYLDENAQKLAKRVHKSETNLRNVAINEYQKLNKILENCPLCHHEDTETPPIAPVVSLATRTYLTLPTEPELSPQSTMIVPTEHRTNLLECDDDEWEEIRNFMKSLTRMYHDQGRDVIFYENAAFPHRKPHAALCVIPLPYSLGETAPAFFKEAFLSTEDEWSQHKKIIDTLAKAKSGGLGKLAFRRSLVKEMPYFHVWFELDGGIGHVVEDQERWPRGDLFAREIIGGMLGLEPDVIKRQGRWHRGTDKRVEGFRKAWRKFDWTRVLTEGGA
ncbi:uncharacterized protein Z520_08947 [Fonsecaea multimorphosa CBS 102226]|uniref:Cwf19-like C-terminal domain-containing protein n=1 Tax=Fonsecaea multimorphosa CBS 102226 TaxID=1442371 RepID=A0A0D2H0W5_9EURO|nr:uncharacterized protein Z520_08947 [Fonsecaea multimorphosa CBS 102226]KIX95430.1 hypothetical protein Z520_08947 [Fonsecaea multimorphosa CBS 102226]OAL20962.1 hypothetical protein AYO22_08382 [Fonsecaea multimorphosa]